MLETRARIEKMARKKIAAAIITSIKVKARERGEG
jgi:hypothetical protein